MIQMRVQGLAPDQEDDFDVKNGQVLDVLGFVWHSPTWIVWADDDGILHELPSWAARLVREAVPA